MPEVVVRRYCDRCQAYREGAQIRLAGQGQTTVPVCATCGELLRMEKQRVARPLTSELARALAYPFTPGVGIPLVVLAVVSLLVQLVPLLGALLSSALVLATMFLIIRATAAGNDDLASDVELYDNVWLWLSPLFRYLFTWLVAALPALAALVLFGWEDGAPVVLAAAGLGVLYLPAGMIVAAHNEGCLGALNPVPGVRIIGRIPGPYFVTLGFLLLSLAIGAAIGYGARALAALPIPIVPSVLGRLLGLYAPAVMSRQLGVLLREHAEEL